MTKGAHAWGGEAEFVEGNRFSPTSPTSPPAKFAGSGDLIPEWQGFLRVDGLSLTADAPLAITGIVGVADRDVAAFFEAMRDGAEVGLLAAILVAGGELPNIEVLAG